MGKVAKRNKNKPNGPKTHEIYQKLFSSSYILYDF